MSTTSDRIQQLEQQIRDRDVRDLAIKMQLCMAAISSCTCLTKTPEAKYHHENCRYRLIMEAVQMVDANLSPEGVNQTITGVTVNSPDGGKELMVIDESWRFLKPIPSKFLAESAPAVSPDLSDAKSVTDFILKTSRYQREIMIPGKDKPKRSYFYVSDECRQVMVAAALVGNSTVRIDGGNEDPVEDDDHE